jgi:hypothetical protein
VAGASAGKGSEASAREGTTTSTTETKSIESDGRAMIPSFE